MLRTSWASNTAGTTFVCTKVADTTFVYKKVVGSSSVYTKAPGSSFGCAKLAVVAPAAPPAFKPTA